MHLDLPTFVIGSGIAMAVVVASASLWPQRVVDHPRLILALVALLSLGAGGLQAGLALLPHRARSLE